MQNEENEFEGGGPPPDKLILYFVAVEADM